MRTRTKRATVYLDPTLHKALRLQSIETSLSVSELINNAIRNELMEDANDLAIFEKRKDEPSLNFEDFVKELKLDEIV